MTTTERKLVAPWPVEIEAEMLTTAAGNAMAQLTPAQLADYVAIACNEFADRTAEQRAVIIDAHRLRQFEKQLLELRAVDLDTMDSDLAERHRHLLAEAERAYAEWVRSLDAAYRMLGMDPRID